MPSIDIVSVIDIIHITKYTNTSDAIASAPNKVRFCNKHKKDGYSSNIYPGQTIALSVAAVGQENGIVPATIQASLDRSNIQLLPSQIMQETTINCANLSYTIKSNNSEDFTMTLAIAGICSTPGQKLTVQIALMECPDGFQLANEIKECTCESRLRKYTNTCNITDQTILRDKNFWVGYSKESGLILHPYCLLDYCISTPVNFTLNETDKQCNNNRTGLLCGQCKPGFSLILRGSVCREDCSDKYLSLTVIFLVSGVALVLLLSLLRLTVVVGTINGLALYANLIHRGQYLFFPSGKTNLLTMFIAWVNLDTKLNLCYYRGMDGYARAWLTLGFPFFIWTLCCSIILLSRKFTCLTTLLGTNPVAVLATLFLLSYTNVLCAVTGALSFTRLEYPNNTSKIVWLYDANVSTAKILPLATFSAVIFFILLPYTIFLLTNQWLQAWSKYRMLSWMNSPRVKFFIDAYNAPFKPKHRYWTGVLLIARLAVELIFLINLHSPAFQALTISVIGTLLLVWQAVIGGSYVNTLLGILEISFIANIVLLAAGICYARTTESSVDLLSYISAGIALATFIGIILYHIYLCVKGVTRRKLKCCGNADTDGMYAEDDTLFEERIEDEDEDGDEQLPSLSELSEVPPSY